MRDRGFFVVVHRLDVMQRLMQISFPMSACGTKAGGDGVLAGAAAQADRHLHTPDRPRAGGQSEAPGVELPIRLHLLDGGEPTLPHLRVSGPGAGRVAHLAEQITDLGRAAHALPVLSDELEHGEVRLFAA